MHRRSSSRNVWFRVCLAATVLAWAPATESSAARQLPDRDGGAATLTGTQFSSFSSTAQRPIFADNRSAAFGARAQQLRLPVVQIADSRYWYGNLGRIGANLIRTPSVRTVLRIINLCRTARAYGFVATRGRGAGVVAWMPEDPRECFGTTGGGPSGDPCLQAFRTPARPRYYVFIAATGRQVCADLSTQAPGGVTAQTTRGVPGLRAGSVIRVKCQVWTAKGLLDYVASYSSSLPASKRAYWIYDYYVATGVDGRLAGVPTCWGVDL